MAPTPVRHKAVAARSAFTQSGEGKGLATAPIAAITIAWGVQGFFMGKSYVLALPLPTFQHIPEQEIRHGA